MTLIQEKSIVGRKQDGIETLVPAEGGLKIVKLTAENFKRLSAVSIEPEGDVVKICGRNAQGKSSILDAIWAALGGERIAPTKPIKEGETEATIILDLGEYIVERSFSLKESGDVTTKLMLRNKDGRVFKSPQTLLDKMIGDLSFDPLAFARAKARDRRATLLEVVNLQIDQQRAEELAERRLTPEELASPLETIDKIEKELFTIRTGVNRESDQAAKVAAKFADVIEVKPVTVSSLINEMQELEAINKANAEARQMVSNVIAELKGYSDELLSVRNEIEVLEQKLTVYRTREAELVEIGTKRREEGRALRSEVEQLADVDLTDIRKRIQQADETNRLAALYDQRIQAEDRANEYHRKALQLTTRIDGLRKVKIDMLQRAQYPVPGLSFGENDVEYNGIPFEQSSGAEKLRVSTGIAMALNPGLRVIRIDDGSLLDSDNMLLLEKLAAGKGYQVWIECVDESGQVGVVIEDGKVKN